MKILYTDEQTMAQDLLIAGKSNEEIIEFMDLLDEEIELGIETRIVRINNIYITTQDNLKDEYCGITFFTTKVGQTKVA